MTMKSNTVKLAKHFPGADQHARHWPNYLGLYHVIDCKLRARL
jgi:hypothetical protein